MALASLGFNKSSSNNVSSGATAGYDLQENISQSGSQQGSNAVSSGLNISQSGQNIYGAQEPYLQNLYANAGNLYNNYGLPDRQVADINPIMAQGLGQQYGFSQGTGEDIFRQQLAQSLANTAGFGTAGNAAATMAGGNVYGAPINRGIDMQTAAQASYNPYLNGQIDAASRDVTRNLYENQLTGNAGMAAGTGNSGSSRRAVMDAIAMRGAGDRVADISSNLRGQAYNTGLGIAAQQGLSNQSAQLGTNTVNANLMGQGANLAYNIGQAGQTGMNQAYNTGVNNAQLAQDVGGQLRQYQQQLLDTQYSNEMNPYNSLQMYKSLIGDPTVLSSSNSIGLDNSTSNSFGDSFNNSYSYGMGANMGSNSATGSAKSFGANASFGPSGT
jgi:hypothetical protein